MEFSESKEVCILESTGIDRSIVQEISQPLQAYIPELTSRSTFVKSLDPIKAAEPWINLILSVPAWKALCLTLGISFTASFGKKAGEALGKEAAAAISNIIAQFRLAKLKAREGGVEPIVSVSIPNPNEFLSSRLIIDPEDDQAINHFAWFTANAEIVNKAVEESKLEEPSSSFRYIILIGDGFIIIWATELGETGFRKQEFDDDGNPINPPKDITKGDFDSSIRHSSRDDEIDL